MRSLIYKLLKFISALIYKSRGFDLGLNATISIHNIVKVGAGKIKLANNSQINRGCFFLAMDDITIGCNTAVAYNVTMLTSANPNYPFNKLSKIYPPKHAPINIGANCWIGANSVILPGVSIGDNVVVAAGSIVNSNIQSNVMVAGNPAKIKKSINYDNKMDL